MSKQSSSMNRFLAVFVGVHAYLLEVLSQIIILTVALLWFLILPAPTSNEHAFTWILPPVIATMASLGLLLYYVLDPTSDRLNWFKHTPCDHRVIALTRVSLCASALVLEVICFAISIHNSLVTSKGPPPGLDMTIVNEDGSINKGTILGYAILFLLEVAATLLVTGLLGSAVYAVWVAFDAEEWKKKGKGEGTDEEAGGLMIECEEEAKPDEGV